MKAWLAASWRRWVVAIAVILIAMEQGARAAKITTWADFSQPLPLFTFLAAVGLTLKVLLTSTEKPST